MTKEEMRQMTRDFIKSAVKSKINEVSTPKSSNSSLITEARQGTFQSNDLKLIATVIDNLTEMSMGYDTDEDMKNELLMQVGLLQDVYSSLHNTTVGYPK